MIGTLRAALASGAFDFDTGRVKDERLGVRLEEARDRVCDMLTEVERSVRRGRFLERDQHECWGEGACVVLRCAILMGS